MRSPNIKRPGGPGREHEYHNKELAHGRDDARRYAQTKRADRPKLSIRDALVILRRMEAGSGTIDALERAAHVSRATVYRLLADCEEELGIRFSYHGGTYSVRDWGLLSRRRVLG